jgi:hypothetical protein
MYFLYTPRKGYFGRKRAFINLVYPDWQEDFLRKTLSILREKMCWMFLLLTKKCFSGEIHVFLQLTG